MDSEVRIVSDGTFTGTEVRFNGQLVPARAVTWRTELPTELPVAEVSLDVGYVQVMSGEVRWIGLEEIPADVLQDEIDRRTTEPTDG